MRPRKKIIKPVLKDYFHLERKRASLNNQLYYNTQVFNGFSFLTLFSITCMGLGFFNSLFWSVGISTIILLVYLYKKCSRLCEGISIVRGIPKYSVEKNEITVSYKVSNATGFKLKGLNFFEEFDGVQEGRFEVSYPANIPPETQVTIKQKVYLNGGMGIKAFKPIRLDIRDELGIFDFKLEFLQSQEIEVYPYIEETPAFKNSISPDSVDYGFYEISKRGDSNLFMGTREYRHGDPVRLINWKLTKKSQKVIVNEYEKSTNTFITLILDLNLKSQTGTGEVSTWEITKDLALSICQNEIKKSNSIQVLSNDLYIPWGSGKNQIELFEKYFTHHELKSSDDIDFIRHLANLPAKGQIYFICPIFLSPESMTILEQLKSLKANGHRVIVFTANPLKEMAATSIGKTKAIFLELNRHLEANQERIKAEHTRHGIPVIGIDSVKDHTLRDQILQAADELLEAK